MGTLRTLLLFCFSITAVSVFAQYENAIRWDSGHRLQWDDFKAEPPTESRVAAITASGIAYQFSAEEYQGAMKVDYSIDTFFYPESSWFRPESANSIILSHEQLHFDITELFARKMRDRVAAYTFTSNVKEEMRSIYQEVLAELAEFQKRYDEETNFSRHVEIQLKWNQSIAEALSGKL